MKKQVLVIHGGTTFTNNSSYIKYLKSRTVELPRLRISLDWKQNLQKDLGGNFDVLLPRMPNTTFAKYDEWKITFEKILAICDKKLILVGHSMGAVFLIKFLAENTIDKKILSLHLVAGPIEDDDLIDEVLGTFKPPTNLSSVSKQAKKIYIYHSFDDPVVPIANAEKLHKALSKSFLKRFDNRGHFLDKHFPELVKSII